MAAKGKAPAKAKAGAVAKQPNKTKAKTKGLNLTPAQFAAYRKAYSAQATLMRRRLAIAAARKAVAGAARGLRKYRLNAAYANIKQYNNAYRNAQAAAVAANATRMTFQQSRLGHQNRALQLRAEQNMFHHAQLLGRAQYVQAGIRAYAHTAVMRTITQPQALSAEAKLYAKLLKNALQVGKVKKGKKKKGKFKPGPNSAVIAKAARVAGLAAASRVPRTGNKVGRPKTRAPKPKGKRGRPKGAKSTTAKVKRAKAAVKQNARVSAHSKKAPFKTPKGRTAPGPCGVSPAAAAAYAQAMARTVRPHVPKRRTWLGDEITPNCVIVAVANHLLNDKGIAVDDASIQELTDACPAEPAIEEVLWKVWMMHWPRNSRVHLKDYFPAGKPWDAPGRIIGYETEHGAHAALSLEDNLIVSWGSVSDRGNIEIEEAWELIWVS